MKIPSAAITVVEAGATIPCARALGRSLAPSKIKLLLNRLRACHRLGLHLRSHPAELSEG